MQLFKDGDSITIDPWRARTFPVIKGLVVDRQACDRIIQTGGFISISAGSAPEANAIPISKETAELAMDAASCIGCGTCVTAYPNASAMLSTAAKHFHIGLLPQGQSERYGRALKMVTTMDQEMFGACTNTGKCETACPKEILIEWIARMNKHYLKASVTSRSET